MAIGEEKDLGEFQQVQEYSRKMAVKALEEGNDIKKLRKKIYDVSK